MKKTALAVLILSSVVFACAKKVPPPPVTDSNYFNVKMERLADDLMAGTTKKVRRAAVLGFVNPNGKTSQLGKYLATKFSKITVLKKYFHVPTEGQVSETIRNLGINYNGTLDKESTTTLGEALGVDMLITGVIMDLQKGSDVDLTVKMIEVRSGTIVSAASASFYRSKQVSTMLEAF